MMRLASYISNSATFSTINVTVGRFLMWQLADSWYGSWPCLVWLFGQIASSLINRYFISTSSATCTAIDPTKHKHPPTQFTKNRIGGCPYISEANDQGHHPSALSLQPSAISPHTSLQPQHKLPCRTGYDSRIMNQPHVRIHGHHIFGIVVLNQFQVTKFTVISLYARYLQGHLWPVSTTASPFPSKLLIKAI